MPTAGEMFLTKQADRGGRGGAGMILAEQTHRKGFGLQRDNREFCKTKPPIEGLRR